MTWDEDLGYRYSSLTVMFFMIGIVILFSVLYSAIRDKYMWRRIYRLRGEYKGNLWKEIPGEILFWLLLWIPFIGIVWLGIKIGI